MTLPPVVPYTVNPVPELPPMPESRMDGHFNDDGDFVPNKKHEEEKQVNENRIHGVKTESLDATRSPSHPATSRTIFNNDPPKAYSKVRGVGLVTVSPSHLPRNYHHLLSSQNTNSGEETTTPRAQPEPRGPKNARQWQTTATKISSNQMRINEGAFDGTIEFIDRISEDPEERVNESPTPKVKRIQTTNLPIGAFGSHENLDFTSPIPPSARSQYRGKIPLERTVIPKRVVLPNKRQRFFNDGNVRHIQLERTQHFNYAPKQRTVQPEVVIPVTVAPKAKPRYLPNPPKPQQIFHDAKLVPVTLPPQPPNRAPEDAAFLAEIEEYDWRLYYKQQALENSPPKANPLNGFSRVHGSPQSGSTSLNNDYEDIEAIKNREHFTDNPPQKSFTLPSSIVTSPPENEVLVPFNNAKGKLSANKINVGGQAPVAHSIGTGRNSAPANVGNNFQGPTGYQGVTPNPLFGNFFNLFNLNGQNNGGFFLPGFGR